MLYSIRVLSPTLTSGKFWPGTLGRTANVSIVQIIIDVCVCVLYSYCFWFAFASSCLFINIFVFWFVLFLLSVSPPSRC
jgi:hypothetical protein